MPRGVDGTANADSAWACPWRSLWRHGNCCQCRSPLATDVSRKNTDDPHEPYGRHRSPRPFDTTNETRPDNGSGYRSPAYAVLRRHGIRHDLRGSRITNPPPSRGPCRRRFATGYRTWLVATAPRVAGPVGAPRWTASSGAPPPGWSSLPAPASAQAVRAAATASHHTYSRRRPRRSAHPWRRLSPRDPERDLAPRPCPGRPLRRRTTAHEAHVLVTEQTPKPRSPPSSNPSALLDGRTS